MKRIAVAAVSIVALLAILVAATPYVIPGAFLRDLVASQISAWTGRTVTVGGEPHLSVYPDLAITVDNVMVANPDGTGEEAFVTADGVRASVRILPLLIGRAEFDEFDLIRPRIRLVVAKDGTTNWLIAAGAIAEQVARAARSRDDAAAGEDNGNGIAATDMQIGRVRITDGIVLYDDLASDHREELTDLDLDVEWPSILASARGSGSLSWRGERVEFTGVAADPVALVAGGASPIRFAVAATILRASFAGEASTAGSFHLDGRASVSTPSLRRAIEWTGTPMGPGAILGAASIDGAARWAGRAISFETATVELDGNRAEGALSFVLTDTRPAVEGTIASERLDLTPYVEAARGSATAEGSWVIAPVGLAFADALDADVRVTAGQVLIGATRLGNVEAGVTVKDGAIGVDIATGQLYGGSLVARVGAGMVGDALVAGADAEISGVPARVALADLAGIDSIDGTAAVSLSVQTRGATWGELARGLAGTGAVSVTRGTLTGLDITAIAETMADPLAEPLDAVAGSTAFSRLATTLTIGNGGLSTEDLTMSGSGYSLALAGKGSLISGLIEAKATLASRFGDIPLDITGRWRVPLIARQAPAALPDEQAITHDESGAATGG